MCYYVIDYFSQDRVPRDLCIRFVNAIEDGIKFYEYTIDATKLIYLYNDRKQEFYNKERFEDQVIFDNRIGQYKVLNDVNDEDRINCKYNLSTQYNYNFPKHYEARENFNVFNNKQIVLNNFEFKLSKYLKYTFGLEFETAVGTIPEDKCFRDGLIPLRDGSITGNEYSTVILEGNKGLNLLKQQLNTLTEHTYFDKNCSLHMHFGGIEFTPKIIWNVYRNCLYLQTDLQTILPSYTFRTSEYKDTGKDYCKMLPRLESFDAFYKFMVGMPYLGDLHQPHPKDVERMRKWNIDKRYYWVNFINVLCYHTNKTIEFRFLRPTYNINKIIFWMYIFNAIILASEEDIIVGDLKRLVSEIYPDDIAHWLKINIIKTHICTMLQTNLKDYIGERTDIENNIFDTEELI